jgi:peptide/nickel transport system substrate-binding protein
MVRQLYVRQALEEVFDQLGIIKAIYRGYGVPTSGPAPNSPPGNQWIPPAQTENSYQGPYPFSISKAKALLTSHGWSEVGGVMTCQDPAKCGTGIAKGQQLKLSFVYSTGTAATTAMWQTYKSDASEAGIDINLLGETFNSIVGQAAPCAPMGPKCAVQVFAYGGWAFDGPGFEPTGEPLFATGAGSNAGNYWKTMAGSRWLACPGPGRGKTGRKPAAPADLSLWRRHDTRCTLVVAAARRPRPRVSVRGFGSQGRSG